MRYKGIFFFVLIVFSLSLISAPHITSVSWNMTQASAGQPVRLNVQGSTDLDGHTISFKVLERDAGGTDDNVITNPPNIVFWNPSSYSTWTAEWQDDTDGGQTNPPEYYFVATVVSSGYFITSSTADVDMLKVYTCGDGACNNGETCDTCPSDCGTCIPVQVCGDGIKQGTEECDDGNTVSEDGCSSTCTIESGWTCDTATPNVCTPICTSNCEQVRFFGVYQGIIVLAVVILIYVVYYLSRKRQKKKLHHIEHQHHKHKARR